MSKLLIRIVRRYHENRHVSCFCDWFELELHYLGGRVGSTGIRARHTRQSVSCKGYRWVTVNGPYACTTEQEVRKITSDRADLRELQMVENLQAYYLIPGTLVRVIQDDHLNGMSEILVGGITRSLWTYTKFLTVRPMYATFGIVETPDTTGLVDPGDASIGGETSGPTLNERAKARTP